MTPEANPGSAVGIADLSYRGYDGPLRTRAVRWWIVSAAGIRPQLRRWQFWSLAALCSMPHLFAGIQLYMRNRMLASAVEGFSLPPEPYALVFFRALDGQGFFLFLLALALGAGSIAADSRANALLIYLSRPITRLDYLLGKWMGIFLPILILSFLPAAALYAYCLLSYLDDGFLKQDPWLILRLAAGSAVPAALHASFLLGCSAWFRTGRLAGAAYAGAWFATSLAAGLIWAIRHRGDLMRGAVERHLSLPGLMRALEQNVYAVTEPVRHFQRSTRSLETTLVPPPTLWLFAALAAALILAALLLAWVRVRAVEVTRG